MRDSDALLDVAVALADGVSVDWATAAGSASSDDERQSVRELQFIASLVQSLSEWGPLRIIEHVGKGTFGDVFRAWDTRLDREVALKLLRRDDRDRGNDGSTVVHEGRILARVRHPNVVTVYGAEMIDGQVGIWMEFVRGRTLTAELQREGPMSAARAVDAGVAVADALAAVHAAGLVHRDIKAQNVMRAEDGRIVLTDFGAGCERVTSVTGARDVVGTPLYLAPETLTGEPATIQSDIYSIGVLLFYLLTGTFPVSGRTLDEVRDAHAHGARTTLRQVRPDVGDRLAEVVERAIAANPAARFPTAAALSEALLAAARPRANRGLMTALTIALVAVVATASMSIGRDTTSPNPAARASYAKGRALTDPHRGARDLRRAASLFEQAIVEDPGFAAAHAALAETWALLSINYGGVAPGDVAPKIEHAALTAVSLAPQIPQAHTAMGIVAARQLEWSRAEAEFQTALRLDRRRAPAYVAFAVAGLFPQGKLREASRQLTTAMRYEALPHEILRQLAWVQVSLGEYDAAIRNADLVIAVDPSDIHVQQVRARALLHKGELAQAVTSLERLGPGSRGFLGYAYASAGHTAAAEEILTRDRAFPARQALVAAGLGRTGEALQALTRMIDATEPRAGIYLTYPEFASLRADPRFARLRARLRLP